MSVPSIQYAMDVMPWNENQIAKLEVRQNKVASMALHEQRYSAIEVLRGDIRWTTHLWKRRWTLRLSEVKTNEGCTTSLTGVADGARSISYSSKEWHANKVDTPSCCRKGKYV